MATIIQTRPSGILASSEVPEFRIATGAAALLVRLSSEDALLYEQRLFSYSGYVTVYDLRSIIEADMQNEGYTLGTYSLEVFEDEVSGQPDASISFEVLHCRNFFLRGSVAEYVANHFLSTLDIRALPLDFPFSLHWVQLAGEPEVWNIDCVCRDRHTGEMIKDSWGTGAAGAAPLYNLLKSRRISGRDVLNEFAERQQEDPARYVLCTFVARAGARAMQFFIVDENPNALNCSFLNIFNVEDIYYLPCSSVIATNVEQSVAVIGGISTTYDRKVSESIEIQSADLAYDDARFLSQFLSSHSPRIVTRFRKNGELYSSNHPIVISESTCEISDKEATMNSIKFKFSFADTRPALEYAAPSDIFSSQFNYVYN